MTQPLQVGIVAGEVSGDILGASLMSEIANQVGDVNFLGIGGDNMLACGLKPIAGLDQLSINGFVDPILRLKPLLQLLLKLRRELSNVDVFVGVDFNVFNLLLERSLKKRGVPTAHYVSPSVYAWRRGRIKRIDKATDVVMTLFPFEIDVYQEQGVNAVFVGHPTADQFDPLTRKEDWKLQSRQRLGISNESFVLGVLPGSRKSELEFHFELFLNVAREFLQKSKVFNMKVMIPSVHEATSVFWDELKERYDELDVEITTFPGSDVLAASDLALVKSGTATLEALLVKTPMVIAYKVGTLTAKIVASLLKTQFVGLPNILAKKRLVPEHLQDDATVDNLTRSLLDLHEANHDELAETYSLIHQDLKRSAAAQAAETVISLVGQHGKADRRTR